MSEYRQKIEGFSWPSHLDPEIRWLARDRSITARNCDWFGFKDEPYIDDGWCWHTNSWCKTDAGILSLPEGRKPLLLCRDDYVMNAEAATPNVTAMEKALREISGMSDWLKEQAEYAGKIIATWPAWKKGLLGRFSQPMSETPRPFIDNHSVLCSGDHSKPVGEPGCCCLRMLKENHS